MQSINKNKAVSFFGYQKNVQKYLLNSSVYVLPSYHEGLPRSIIEAMSVGRPIITTNVPGCKETVIDGENGFLINSKNHIELYQKMEWFIKNNDKIKYMGDKSYEIVKKYFNIKLINSEYMKIFDLW